MTKIKKFLFFIILLPFIFAATPAKTTVDHVLSKAKNYDNVVLEGKLVQQLDDDEFVFQDSTGKLKVEFDDDVFKKNMPSMNTQIKILGIVKTSKIRDSEVKVTNFKYLEKVSHDDDF